MNKAPALIKLVSFNSAPYSVPSIRAIGKSLSIRILFTLAVYSNLSNTEKTKSFEPVYFLGSSHLFYSLHEFYSV